MRKLTNPELSCNGSYSYVESTRNRSNQSTVNYRLQSEVDSRCYQVFQECCFEPARLLNKGPDIVRSQMRKGQQLTQTQG
uniref:SREBP regulating gene protein n=1 Tax=Heterorhabditis bacteriophora TaxID=37862 RepID=A0A1I7WDX7_HETBA